MDSFNPSSPCGGQGGLPSNDDAINYLHVLFSETGYADPFLTVTPSNEMQEVASWVVTSPASNENDFPQYLQFEGTEDSEPLLSTVPLNNVRDYPALNEHSSATLNEYSSSGVYIPMNNGPSDLSNQIWDNTLFGCRNQTLNGQLSTGVYNFRNNIPSMEVLNQNPAQPSWRTEHQTQNVQSTCVYNPVNNEPSMEHCNQNLPLTLRETDNQTQYGQSSTPAYIPSNNDPSIEFSESWESNNPSLNGQSLSGVYIPMNNERSIALPNKKPVSMLCGSDYPALNESSSTCVFNPMMGFNPKQEGMVCGTNHQTVNEQSIDVVNTRVMHSSKNIDQAICGTNHQTLNDQASTGFDSLMMHSIQIRDQTIPGTNYSPVMRSNQIRYQTLQGTNYSTLNDQSSSDLNSPRTHSNQIWDRTGDPTINDQILTDVNTLVLHSNQIQYQTGGSDHPNLNNQSSTAFNIPMMRSNINMDQALQGTDQRNLSENSTRINNQMMSHDPFELTGHVGGCNSSQEGIYGQSQISGNNMELAVWNEDPKPVGEINSNAVVTNYTASALDGIGMDQNGWNDRSVVDCSGCTILREMVHSNGVENKKLMIHGRSDELCHARIENKYIVDGMLTVQSSLVNFQNQSFESIKKFIVDYAHLRAREGYSMICDTLPTYIKTVTVQVSHVVSTSSIPETRISDKDFCDTGTSVADVKPRKKTGIAAQRERTGKLHISDLAPYFHTPIEHAAKQLKLCVTVLKKVCRKHNMKRWPHRKIKGFDRSIAQLRRRQQCGEPVLQDEITKLEEQKARIYDVCRTLPAKSKT